MTLHMGIAVPFCPLFHSSVGREAQPACQGYLANENISLAVSSWACSSSVFFFLKASIMNASLPC